MSDSDIPSPSSITVTGPLNHSFDYKSCWRIFCLDSDILFDSLTRSTNRVPRDTNEFETVFLGTENKYHFSISKRVTNSVIVSSFLLPSLSKTDHSLGIPHDVPTVLVHGVAASWKPCSAAHWHALDFYVQNLSDRSIENFVENFCVSQASIDLIVWGLDGVPLNCFKKLLNEWTRKNRNSKLVFVCQTLMSLDTGFVSLFDDPRMVVGVPVPPTEAASLESKNIVDIPEIDVSQIPASAIEIAKTNFIIPMTQPELIAPFASIISMAPRVLIHGPSKSGKSTLAKWMIREVLMKKFPAINVIEMHASQLFSKYLGGSEKRIQKLFRKAAASAPSVILVEGIHSICPARGRHDDDEEEGGAVGQTYTRILATFLMSLDGIDSLGSEHNKVAFIGTSLLGPDKLDPAAVRPGRLEVHIALDA